MIMVKLAFICDPPYIKPDERKNTKQSEKQTDKKETERKSG